MAELPMLPTNEQLAQWESDWFSESENADVLLINAYAAGAAAGAEERMHAICACLDEPSQQAASLIHPLLERFGPKPPSLKQQALEALDRMPQQNETETIRRALEALPND